MSNRSINPWWPMISGVLMCVAGLVLLGYTIFKYKDWDEVHASYTESDCRIEQDPYTPKGSKPRMVNYCKREIHYTYKGVQYTYTDSKVAQKTPMPEVLLVDPKFPEEPYDNNTNYIWVLGLVLMGLLFTGVGVYARIYQKIH